MEIMVVGGSSLIKARLGLERVELAVSLEVN